MPYYLLFQSDDRELKLSRHTGRKYVLVRPNKKGRHPIPDLQLEVALLEGWARFWLRGELLPLPAELLRQRDEALRQLEEERRARQAAEEELARLRAQLGQPKRPRNGPR